MPVSWTPRRGSDPAVYLQGSETEKSVWIVAPDAVDALVARIDDGTAPPPDGRVFVRDVSVPHSTRIWDLCLSGEAPERIGAKSSYEAAKELARTVRIARARKAA